MDIKDNEIGFERMLYFVFDEDTGSIAPPFPAETEGAAVQAFRRFCADAVKNGNLDVFALYKFGRMIAKTQEINSSTDSHPGYRYSVTDLRFSLANFLPDFAVCRSTDFQNED